MVWLFLWFVGDVVLVGAVVVLLVVVAAAGVVFVVLDVTVPVPVTSPVKVIVKSFTSTSKVPSLSS